MSKSVQKGRFIGDLMKISIARRRNEKKFFGLTVVNVIVAFLLLSFFMQLAWNVTFFLKEQFLSDQYLHHVVFQVNKGKLPEKLLTVVDDDMVQDYRIIYDSDIRVKRVDMLEDTENNQNNVYSYEASDLDITILEADNFLFKGDFESNNLFEQCTNDPMSGIVISSEYVNLFGNDSPLGKRVIFTYADKEYSLPITAVMNYNAALNYSNGGYTSAFYVMSNVLKNTDFMNIRPKAIDVYIENIMDVSKFIEKYKRMSSGKSYYVQASTDYIKKYNDMTVAVGSIIAFVGGIFLLLASFSIINGMYILHYKNKKNYALLKALGFSPVSMQVLRWLDSLQIWGYSIFITMGLYALFYVFLAKVLYSKFGILNKLFKIQIGVIVLCGILILGIILICEYISWGKNKKDEVIEVLKGE